MKNWRTNPVQLMITLDLNQLEHHRKMKTLMHSKLTYIVWYATSNLRELVQNSKVTRQKISNALMKTLFIPADKKDNLYKLSRDNYNKLLTDIRKSD